MMILSVYIMNNWNKQEINVAISQGGVIALSNPYDNLISTEIEPWPPSEIVQKLYQSRHAKAYVENQKEKSVEYLGYYSDLQSLHSEDAITWSVFGTAAHSPSEERNKFTSDFLRIMGVRSDQVKNSEIFLWRRIPHPDTLVSGGPEIDFGIFTGDVLLLGEAKWKSSVGASQGKYKDKNQIQLRVEFLNKYGKRIYPNVTQFIVVGLGLENDVTENSTDGVVECVSSTWDDVCGLKSHPNHDELQKYLAWKKENTKNRGQKDSSLREM
jgi:hypothetical protein